MLKKLQFTAKIVKEAGKKITVVASDETLDRHGDVLKIEDWDLKRFNQAPRMLIDHDHRVEKIVGRWENARIENRQLLLDAVFHDITELSREVHQMVESDFLNSVSVGFIYNPPERDGERGTMELIETSWVTVGANPAALTKALEATESDETLAQVKAFIGEEEKKEDKVVDKVLTPDEKDAKILALEKTIETLTADKASLSEKLRIALTKKKEVNKKAAVTKLLLQEIARNVNQGLYLSKR